AIIAGRQDAAVGRQRNFADPTGMHVDRVALLAGDFPDAASAIGTGRRKELAVARKRYRLDLVAVSREAANLFARRRVPEPNRSVPEAGHHLLAVRSESDAAHGIGQPFALADFLAGSRFPESQRLVNAARRDGRAVGREGDGGDVGPVALEFTNVF